MTDRDALYRAILAHPGDDTPRLVYADWLQENDRPEEAEFIRVGYRLEAESPAHPDYAEWLTRQEELTRWLQTHAPVAGPRFKGGLAVDGGDDWWRVTRRGFPRYLDFDGNVHFAPGAVAKLAKALENAFTVLPTRWLAVRFLSQEQLVRLLREPVLGRLDALTVQLRYDGEPHDEAARLLAECPHLGNLRGLSVAFDTTDAGAAALARSVNFARLEWLSLEPSGLDAAAVARLGAAAWFRNLRSLDLSSRLRGEAFEQLGLLPPMPRLHTLDLRDNELPAAGWQAFARSKTFPALARLDLQRTSLSDGRMAAFAGAKWFRPAYLDLTACAIGDAGAAALARAPWLGSLRWLGLHANRLGPTGVKAVVGRPELGGLRNLELGRNTVGVSGLKAIARNPSLRGLIGLHLGGDAGSIGSVRAAHVAGFLGELDAPGLRALTLSGWPVDAAGTRLLAGEKFRSLTQLDLSDCGLTDPAAAALLKGPAFQNMIDLRVHGNKVKEGVAPLTDPRFLPRLACCTVHSNSVPAALEKKLGKRPGVVV